MASFDAPLYTSQIGSAGQTPAVGYPPAKQSAGKMRLAIIPYTVDGAENSGDTINLCKLKEGARVITQFSRVASQAAFDVSDMNIGVAGNDNKYADAMDTTDAELDQPFIGGDNRFVPADVAEGGEIVFATLVTVVTTTAGQLVLFLIAFVDE